MVFKKFISLFNGKWFKLGLAFFLFLVAALIAIAMLLGKEAGYFSIRTQSGDALKSISLSLDYNNEKEYTSGIDAKAIEGFDQTSPTYLIENQFAGVRDLHKNNVGALHLEKSYGYSFYIINTSSNNTSVGVDMKLTMTHDDGLGKAIRVLTYCEYDGKEHFKVYQMKDDQQKTYSTYSYVYGRNALVEFNPNPAGGIIFDNERISISSKDKGNNWLKYTIIFWLEGDDPDCVESILGKSARFQLQASVDMSSN